MGTDAVAAFADAICRHQLLAPEAQEELKRDLRQRFPDPRTLGRELIQRGWLTPYQVNQLAQGRDQNLLLGQYALVERLADDDQDAARQQAALTHRRAALAFSPPGLSGWPAA
jgi:hypothetical protein